MSATSCRRCGSPLDAAGHCGSCLLETGIGIEGQTTAERIFQAALCHDESERTAFIELAASGDATLLEDVRMLLEGYAEAGGDHALPTMGHATNARSQWAARNSEAPGTVIDHFRLVKVIGEGGMGSVWEAEQTAPIKRRVALKVIKLGMDTREVVRRFERERSTLALMTHPCIASVFEAGATPLGRPYFAMELVEGDTITGHCRAASLGVRERLSLFLEVCGAIEHAHQKGVIHRDLKPSNILVSGDSVKVIDFGVAKATREEGGDALYTRQAQVLGTPAYMSPEQAESEGVDVDTRTDVYSLGVVLYELLCGTLPFDPKRLASTGIREMQRILREEDPPRPSTRITTIKGAPSEPVQRLELHGDLDWIVMKAMSKDRARRYRSAAALADDLQRYLDGDVVSAVPPTLTYQLGKFVRRHRAPVAAGIAVLLALTAGLIASLSQAKRAKTALAGEEQARAEATFTVADMYARSGLVAAENEDDTRAALWFANAAVIAEKDHQRAAANTLRATTWHAESATALRAFDTGYAHLHDLVWNPQHPAIIAQNENELAAQVWDLTSETRWLPQIAIARAAWSRDGSHVAALLPEGSLVVLDYPSGKELARLPSQTALGITWSLDDSEIAAGTTLWHWQSGKTRSFPQFTSCFRFTPDGTRILLQWGDFTGVVNASQPQTLLHPPIPSAPLDRSDFLGDCSRFVVGLPEGGLAIYDTSSGNLLEKHPGRAPPFSAGGPLATSPDGRFIARRNAKALDLQTTRETIFPVHAGGSAEARFSPDGSLLASGDYDYRLELWSVADGKFLGVIGHHHTGVINLAFSPDGRSIASGEDGLVRVWRLPKHQPIREIPVAGPTSVVLSPDGKLAASSGFTQQTTTLTSTQVYDLATGQPVGPALECGGKIMDASFGPNNAWLATAASTTTDRSFEAFTKSGGSGHLNYWNYRTGERIGEAVPLPSEPRGLALHHSGNYLGIACAGGQGIEIDNRTREIKTLFDRKLFVHAGATLNNGRCAYSPDGRIFASWGMIDYVSLWDREQARELIPPDPKIGNAFDLDFHDGVAARAMVSSKLRLSFDSLRDGSIASPDIPYTNWPFLTRFSQDGTLLLTAGGAGSAQVWDWRQGKMICPALSHGQTTIMGGAFIPDTPWVITGSHDGTVRFWDRHNGMPARPSLTFPGWVLELKLTPDTHTLLVSGMLPGGIQVVDLKPLFPSPDLDPASLLLLCEIDADAQVHPGGGLAPFTPQQWLAKWQAFRKQHPDFPGHRLED
ncbi:serine/threonine-protein kinase [Luteolibacter soli]|uniref:Serine/threonine-protein kinase n=1 Tax=Luteolibacter soli TaxID=3135280 RepID=A0ABU9AS59_9BACT